MEKAKSLYAQANYDKAKVEFKNVLQIDPKSAEANYFVGRIEERRRIGRTPLTAIGERSSWTRVCSMRKSVLENCTFCPGLLLKRRRSRTTCSHDNRGIPADYS